MLIMDSTGQSKKENKILRAREYRVKRVKSFSFVKGEAENGRESL